MEQVRCLFNQDGKLPQYGEKSANDINAYADINTMVRGQQHCLVDDGGIRRLTAGIRSIQLCYDIGEISRQLPMTFIWAIWI